MTIVESVSRASSYERRAAIAEDADARQQQIIGDVLVDGFAFDWSFILGIGDVSDPLASIESRLNQDARDEALSDTISALGINGKLLAAFVQKRNEEDAGFIVPANILPAEFKEPTLALPEGSIEYWRKQLNLTDDQVTIVRKWLSQFSAETHEVRGRVTDTLMRKLAKLYSEAIVGDEGVPVFLKKARELMPDAAKHLLEGEYRTHLSEVYGKSRHEQVVSRANAFPFMQFFAIIDTRTTWYICRALGMAGPGRKGYIAATTDAWWFKFRPPLHFGGCRSTIGGIGYRECQRMGILDADGKTKTRGDRPFGDPPDFAVNPDDSSDVRAVQPQDGFGA